MQLFIKKKEKTRNMVDWFLHMVGYTFVFIIVTSLFPSIYIDNNHLIIWSILIELLIYTLNKTIKPILITLTIPITGLTLGLFYPCINVFILKLADWLLGNHFNITRIYSAFIAAILISMMNFIMEQIMKKMIRKVKEKEGKK